MAEYTKPPYMPRNTVPTTRDQCRTYPLRALDGVRVYCLAVLDVLWAQARRLCVVHLPAAVRQGLGVLHVLPLLVLQDGAIAARRRTHATARLMPSRKPTAKCPNFSPETVGIQYGAAEARGSFERRKHGCVERANEPKQ